MAQVRTACCRPLLTVSDRQWLMLRARGGHGRRGPTALQLGGDGYKLNRRVRPVQDDHLARWQGSDGCAVVTVRSFAHVVPTPPLGADSPPQIMCGHRPGGNGAPTFQVPEQIHPLRVMSGHRGWCGKVYRRHRAASTRRPRNGRGATYFTDDSLLPENQEPLIISVALRGCV